MRNRVAVSLMVLAILIAFMPALAERPSPPPKPVEVVVSSGSCLWMSALNGIFGLPPGAYTTTYLVYGSNPVTPTCMMDVYFPSIGAWEESGYADDYPSDE